MNENAQAPKMSLWSKHFILIMLVNCFLSVCMYFHNAVTTLYVVSLGGTKAYAGVMLTCFTIVATIMRIVSGRLLDKRGRRKIILIGVIIYAAATVSITTGFLPYLPVARAIQAIGYSMATTGVSVAITDVLPVPHMGEGIGYSGLMNSLAAAVGPIIALAIYDATGNYALVYYASVVILVLAFIIMFICKYETDTKFFERKQAYELAVLGERAAQMAKKAEEKSGSFLATIFEKDALPCTIINLFISLGNGAIVAFLTVFAEEFSIANYKYFYTLQAISTVAARLCCSKLSDKYHPLVSVLPGSLIIALSYFFLVLAPEHNVLFFLAGAGLGIGSGVVTPALNAEAVRHVPQSRRGAASATFFISIDIGIGIGGILWGKIIDAAGFKPAFGGCVIGVLISMVLAVVLLLIRGKKKEAKAA